MTSLSRFWRHRWLDPNGDCRSLRHSLDCDDVTRLVLMTSLVWSWWLRSFTEFVPADCAVVMTRCVELSVKWPNWTDTPIDRLSRTRSSLRCSYHVTPAPAGGLISQIKANQLIMWLLPGRFDVATVSVASELFSCWKSKSPNFINRLKLWNVTSWNSLLD